MSDHITHLIDRLEAADGAEVPSLCKSLIKSKELSGLMKRINADLMGQDHGQRHRAAQVLTKLGFPLEI
jgi:hypothetical protein